MLMYGTAQNIVDNATVFNLSSLREGIHRLNCLIPPNSVGIFTERDFDIAYANYIMGNDIVFYQFFSIIWELYLGKNVYIAISENDWSENLVESLFKLIQQRYGYNAFYIGCPDDYIALANSTDTGDFARGYGLFNLDQDKERYSYLMANMMPRGDNYDV
jgi:hypothetical protein